MNVPCDNGDGRTGRALVLAIEDDVLEDGVVDAVDATDGREPVADDDEEDEEVFL